MLSSGLSSQSAVSCLLLWCRGGGGGGRPSTLRFCLCAPASLPAARRTSSSGRRSESRESCPATPCEYPSSLTACLPCAIEVSSAPPTSASSCQHRSPSPGSPDPGVRFSFLVRISNLVPSHSRPSAMRWTSRGPAAVAVDPVPCAGSNTQRGTQSASNAARMIDLRNIVIFIEFSLLVDSLAGEVFSGGQVCSYRRSPVCKMSPLRERNSQNR